MILSRKIKSSTLYFWKSYHPDLWFVTDRCYGPEPPCQRDGYQDPNNCYSCICPDGFAGDHCQYVDSYRGPGMYESFSFRITFTIITWQAKIICLDTVSFLKPDRGSRMFVIRIVLSFCIVSMLLIWSLVSLCDRPPEADITRWWESGSYPIHL